MVSVRFTALAVIAIAAPLNALLFSTAPRHGGMRRLANANPIPAPVEGRSDYYRGVPVKAKRSGPAKAAHCGTKKHSRPAHGSSTSKAANEKIADIQTTTTAQATTKVQAPATTTKATTKVTTTVKAATATAASSGSTNGSVDDGLTADQRSTFLSLHNSIRSQHGAGDVTWSSNLAAAAKTWADKCIWDHSRGAVGPYGENLASGAGGGYDVTAAVKSWTDEISQYDSSNPVPSHYTQVVWKGTKQIGCALNTACTDLFDAKFGAELFFVCEYYPPGNVIGEFAQNVQ